MRVAQISASAKNCSLRKAPFFARYATLLACNAAFSASNWATRSSVVMLLFYRPSNSYQSSYVVQKTNLARHHTEEAALDSPD